MIETTINNVDTIIFAFVSGAFGSFTPIVSTLWRLMFIIFIAVFGYKVIISGRFSASDLLVNMLKIIILLIVATRWDHFTLLVYNITTDLPADIAGVLISSVDAATATPGVSNEATANTALSAFYDRAMMVTSKVLEGAGWTKWGLYIYAFVIWFGALAFTGFAAMLIILSKMAVAILLAVAPLFILLLIFANSKSLFDGWLRTLLNYAVIPIFVYGVLALMLSISELPLQFLENNSNPDDAILSSIAPFLFICVVSVLILSQVMNLSASVTGGLSLSTMGAGAWTARKFGNFVKSAPKTGTKSLIHGQGALMHPKQSAQAAAARLKTAIQKTRGF